MNRSGQYERTDTEAKKVIIIGGGFGGLNCAKALGGSSYEVTLLDRRNHHLFQPLLYQVAMAGLSPADIAVPIRKELSMYPNITVIQEEVARIVPDQNKVCCDGSEHAYDFLVMAAGAGHSYFGNDAWQNYAPGLKTLMEATHIRAKVLKAYELAEKTTDPALIKKLLTFVVIGGGPTGVELAGALGEMSRFTLSKDFKNIDSRLARVVLIEAGPRILAPFSEASSSQATRDLESLGVQVWTHSKVTSVSANGVAIGDEQISAATVLWGAGVQASSLGRASGFEVDRMGRIPVGKDLTIPGYRNVFVIGDQAHVKGKDGQPLPGQAPPAIQQGRFVAKLLLKTARGKQDPDATFEYWDKGQMATIGRQRAVLESGPIRMKGLMARIGWLVVHIYYLTGFRNRLFVVMQWAWSHISYRRGARLIVEDESMKT